MGEGLMSKEDYRVDGVLKVTGQAKYANDINSPVEYVGYIVTSKVAHGIINNISADCAKKMKGIITIVTGLECTKLVGDGVIDTPILAFKKVRYYGEPLAIIVAVDEPSARVAENSITIDISELPVVNSIKEALLPNAPLVHKTFSRYKRVGLEEFFFMNTENVLNSIDGTNIEANYKIRKGNVINLV